MPLAQSAKYQVPISREAPTPEPPILQVWRWNILWGLDVEIWMFTLNPAHRGLGEAGLPLLHHANCESSNITHFSQKPPFVSRCASMALNLNCGKLKAKKSSFFSGHFARKSLANQAKTRQNMLQKCRNFRGLPGHLYESAPCIKWWTPISLRDILFPLMKRWLALLLLILPMSLRADYFPLSTSDKSKPTDLMLIYQGGVQRPRYTVSRFAPYVTYSDPQTGKEQWLFDGFLIIEFQDGRGHTYEQYSNMKHANQAQWTWLLQRNFANNDGVPNLEKAVEAAVARIGEPVRRRQVVLTLPVPEPGQTDWGTLNGHALDFNNKADRLAACNWYMDMALQAWTNLAPRELDLAGFYWVAEQYGSTTSLFPDLAQAVHARGKKFFWIPSYHVTTPIGNWKSFGFDEAYLQPNFFFTPTVPPSRLQHACNFAKEHGMGLEIEFDPRMITDSTVFEPRFHAYLDAFTQYGVRDGAAMAWYEGGGALYRLAVSDSSRWRADYDEVGQFVLKRQHTADEQFKSQPKEAGK
jgi:Domain of unknown function (DUF4855)